MQCVQCWFQITEGELDGGDIFIMVWGWKDHYIILQIVLFKETPRILPISIINRFRSLQGHWFWVSLHFPYVLWLWETQAKLCLGWEVIVPPSESSNFIDSQAPRERTCEAANASCRAPPCFWKRISWCQCFEPQVESREGGKFTWKSLFIFLTKQSAPQPILPFP